MEKSSILPRIFISSVSDEFRTIRGKVAEAVRHLGYEPVTEENWSTGHGELLDWLRTQIDSCEGLIQITGLAYGAEPPQPMHPTPGFPERCSYTQFEFLHARATGKKTWIIHPGDACTRDTEVALLDQPKNPATGRPDPDLPGAADLQAARRHLQQDYLQLLRDGNHLRHKPADDKDLQILILTLRDHAAELRHNFAEWQAFVSGHITRMERKADRLLSRSLVTLAILPALGLSGWAAWRHLSHGNQAAIQGIAGIKEGQTLDTGRVRAHLITASEAALKKDLAEAAAIEGDFQKRETLRQAAEAAHRHRLSRVEAHVATFAELAAATGNSPVLDELLRVLDEQGIDQAIAYLDTRRAEILRKVSNKMEEARAQLQPLLTAAQAALAAGKNDEAESLFRDVLHPDHPRWPEARHDYFEFLVFTRGPRAEIHGTTAEARAIYEESERHARRLTEDEPEKTEWQRDLAVSHNKLGDVAVAQGNLDEAARRYAAALAVREKLAAADPGNTRWQRDLSISHDRLGNVARAQGNLDEAARRYAASLAIAEKLAAADPGNTEWQRDLALSHNKLGNVALDQDKLDEAARRYAAALALRENLTAADPGNREWQWDLSITHFCQGDVAVAKGDLSEATRRFNASLAAREKLAAADPGNTEWQRGLSVSHKRLGNVAIAQSNLDEAARRFASDLAITEKLAAADPSNTEWQRDLFISYAKLADLAETQSDPAAARRHWQAAHDVLDGIHRRGLHLSPQDRANLQFLKEKLATPPGE